MIKQLKDTRSQRKKFAVYGSKAQGQSRADHALSICAGEYGKVVAAVVYVRYVLENK